MAGKGTDAVPSQFFPVDHTLIHLVLLEEWNQSQAPCRQKKRKEIVRRLAWQQKCNPPKMHWIVHEFSKILTSWLKFCKVFWVLGTTQQEQQASWFLDASHIDFPGWGVHKMHWLQKHPKTQKWNNGQHIATRSIPKGHPEIKQTLYYKRWQAGSTNLDSPFAFDAVPHF